MATALASGPSSSSNTKRNPPPTLFQAPTNSSSTSLAPPSSTSTTQRVSLLRSHSARSGIEVPTLTRSQTQNPVPPPAGQAEDNRVDALWANMQLTLEEVELSALGSTHVFGTAHNAALEELRDAQIALARAWGKGEADEDLEIADIPGAVDDEAQNGESSKGDSEQGEDEGEIAEARRRREANEKFFQRVGDGVSDVVGKLDAVSAAMAKVEKESREIWDEKDSIDGSSIVC
ncbi:uncharacterized protein KY384_006963 [Bacidia gigantensis]|uniref:uncharacterized protein n=1 Tax=Bacidia gigantensis TaxID=2732470 RepID=UPI001D04B450|nr:uncharacterized protein KY384_006963 [Bacidia gigantensis]KAG8528047.1 hypothetical protein KY384_006963 [Bacidia gigantensis]